MSHRLCKPNMFKIQLIFPKSISSIVFSISINSNCIHPVSHDKNLGVWIIPSPFTSPHNSIHYQAYQFKIQTVFWMCLFCLLSWCHYHSPSHHCLSDFCNSFHTSVFYIFPILSILYSVARLDSEISRSNEVIPSFQRKTSKRHEGEK